MARKSKQRKTSSSVGFANDLHHNKQKEPQKPIKPQAKELLPASKFPNSSWPYVLFIALASFITYFNSFYNELIMNWDDAGYIANNLYIRDLSSTGLMAMLTKFYLHNYHPFTMISYAIEYSFAEANPFLYHVNNFLLHVINAALVFIFIKALTHKQNSIPFFVALIFALHPMHVESVAWISERKDLLYTLFFLLSLIFYLRYIDSQQKPWRFLVLSLVLFFSSLMSKSAAVTLAPVLFLLDFYRNRKWSIMLLVDKIPFFVLSFIFGILAIRSQQTAIQDLTPMLSFIERILIAMFALFTYIYKLLLPVNLSAMYAYPIKMNDQLPMIYYIMPLIFAAIAFILWRLRKFKIVVFGFLFFLFNIGLVLQLVPVGGVILSERYTYVPYIGLILILVWPLTSPKKNFVSVYTTILLLHSITFGVLSFDRIKYWKNGDILFSDVIQKYPLLPYAYNNRGFLYWDYYALKVYNENPTQKDTYVQKAYRDFSTAIQLDPSYVEAYSNRAVLLYNTGRIEESLSDFNIVLALDSSNADALIGRANTLSTLKRFDESLEDYTAYLQLKPNDERALVWRGTALTNTGNFKLALDDLRKAAQINPSDHETWYWIALTHFQQSQFDSALIYFDKTLNVKSDFAEAFSWKGLTWFNLRNYQNAVNAYTEALRLNPKDAAALVNRAVSLYQLGQYNESINDLDAAISLGFQVNRDFYMAVKAHKSGFRVH